MNKRAAYKTKQRESLIHYLETAPGEHVTAADVCEYFKELGEPIGLSTVYRHLERLVDEGIIQKYMIDSNSPACFEYVGPEIHGDTTACFHCKCEKCGRLIHLHCDEVEELQRHLYERHNFKINPLRTVFYGICEHCL